MKFESKKDILFKVIVLGLNAILVGIVISIILNGKMELYKYAISIFIIGVVAFWLWTFWGTEYELTESEFIFKSGPFIRKIQISRIKEIITARTLWIGNWPATARKGLIIKFDNYNLINISPESDKKFISKILELNNKIKITE